MNRWWFLMKKCNKSSGSTGWNTPCGSTVFARLESEPFWCYIFFWVGDILLLLGGWVLAGGWRQRWNLWVGPSQLASWRAGSLESQLALWHHLLTILAGMQRTLYFPALGCISLFCIAFPDGTYIYTNMLAPLVIWTSERSFDTPYLLCDTFWSSVDQKLGWGL